MKKSLTKRLQLLAFAALMCGTTANAQLSTNPDKFLGNITTSGNVDYGAEKYYTLWNQITCENETKWQSVEGTNNRYNWNDAAYNYAKKHNFLFKFHAFVWGSQYPTWLETMTPAERYEEIVEWMDNAKKHYPDLKMIDVVNEAITGHQQGTKYFIEALGGAGETGYDWIIKAFELAHERWPEAILIYNDFNTFQWDTDKYITLVKTLRNAGAPIDAYGCQSHDLTDLSFSSFKTVMAKIQNALKMPMYSTEYDIGTTDDAKQLKQYKDQIPYMWEQDYVAGVTLWGYHYGKTWTTDGNSGIIKYDKTTKTYEDRPAMTWLREYMQTDAAKNAKSPFPGMTKEASVYIKPVYYKLEKGKDAKIIVRASMCTKTIEKIDLYMGDNLVATMTEAPYEAVINAAASKTYDLKAVVTCTDGSTYERYSGVTAYNPQTPFSGTPIELPGVIEAEDYDKGTSGISYYDSNSSKEGSGSSYRSDSYADVDKAGDGYAYGHTKVGEWVEYTVNVKEAGLYAINTKYSAAKAGSSFNLSLATIDGLKTLADVAVPNTTASDIYQSAYSRTIIPLEAGEQVIRLSITAGEDNALRIDNLTFEKIAVDDNISISLTPSDEEFMVGVQNDITTDITSSKDIKSVNFYVDGILTHTIENAPFVINYVPAVKGNHTLSAYAIDADGNLSKVATREISVSQKRLPYDGVITIPGIIEAENFDLGEEGYTFHDSDAKDEGNAGYRTDNEGVDIIKIKDGGYAIGYTAVDEWLEYTVNVTQEGKYSCEAIASSDASGAKFKVGIVTNGEVKYPWSLSVPQKGADVYTTVTSRSKAVLPEGKQTIRICITGAKCNIDKIELKAVETAIDDISLDDANSDSHTYNINGQRVGSNYKGIYIKNGKKFIQK